MTIKTALTQGVQLLEDATVPVPRLTAEVLLSHAIGCERVYLYAHSERELREVEWIHYGRYLNERLKGKPTQYVTGRQEFYGREFRVTPAVLIPRPETEHLVEAALPLLGPHTRVLDIGTGSGAIAVTLQLETDATVFATDISPAALSVATRNAAALGSTVQFAASDLLQAVSDRTADLIVSNPPYVPLRDSAGLQREVRDWEPPAALFAGESGHDLYRRLAAEAPRVLREGGWLIMELGFGCAEYVTTLLQSWNNVAVSPDLAGIPRVIKARLP